MRLKDEPDIGNGVEVDGKYYYWDYTKEQFLLLKVKKILRPVEKVILNYRPVKNPRVIKKIIARQMKRLRILNIRQLSYIEREMERLN